MKATISPSVLSGHVQAPASKSSMQRACAAALLCNGETVIINPGYSDDDKAAIEIVRSLGAEIKVGKDQLTINSYGVLPNTNEINCGESGLAIRMFTPIIALSNKEITITGTGSLVSRPMDFFDETLPQLGVSIKTNNGKLPIKIRGPLKPASITIDGSLSSQFLTGLLLAFAASPTPEPGLEDEMPEKEIPQVFIKAKNLKSKPYVQLTWDVMKKFGLANHILHKDFEEFYFDREPGVKQIPGGGGTYTVESDWSGAAFLLVAGAIAGSITIRGLDLSSTQADKAIVDVLMSVNAGIAMETKGIKIRPVDMSAFEFDATDCPDLFPPLVALAAYCKGTTTIKGVNRLKHKESDRAISLQTEFGKMGVRIEIENNTMIIYGGDEITGAIVDSHHDHRIAMALAVAGLKAKGDTTINNAEAINKSYPDFFEDLKKLGADVSLNNKIRLHE